MEPNNLSESDLRNMNQAELMALVDAHTAKYGPPAEIYDSKNSLFGWTEDGKGVWVLSLSEVNSQRFEDIAKLHPRLGQGELLRLAKEQGPTVMGEDGKACGHNGPR
ncbi:hypothetical protein DL546_001684 [Coniochaeta pulveracea]|uniref:Uncharacterized protein n=1 Tax=Coniochaeta pulveracea TaxID=177199 RepID=A0A420Y1T5_9PEZI|nr:hypothetical protein DL546_001684 [Coniochaeta pulveracea]